MTREELLELEALYDNQGHLFAEELVNSFPVLTMEHSAFCIFLYAALLSAAADQPDKLNTFESFAAAFNIDKDSMLFYYLRSLPNIFDVLKEAEDMLLGRERLIKACLLYYEPYVPREDMANYLKPCINRLITKLLAPEAGETVINLAAGSGSFIRDCFSECEDSVSYGISESDDGNYVVALIKAKLLGISIKQFKKEKLLATEGRYKRLFVCQPFLQELCDFSAWRKASAFAAYNPELTLPGITYWFYAGYAAELTEFGGRTVILVPLSALYRGSADNKARMNLIENGKIEAVIEIGDGISSPFNGLFRLAIVVLGRVNSSVRFVRAELPGNADLQLGEQQIDDIVSAFRQDGTFGCAKSISKSIGDLLAEASGEMCGAVRLLPAAIVYPQKGKTLGSCLQASFRTRLFSGKSLEKYFTEKETQIKYLELSNLSDRGFRGRIQCLESLPEKNAELGIPDLAANLLREGDLIISRAGNPDFRFAVAEFGEDKSFKNGDVVIPSSNLFVLRFTDDVNVWFVKAYLESMEGQKKLKEFCGGRSPAPSLRMEMLKDCFFIPDADRELQDETAEEYCRLHGEIEKLNATAEKKSKELQLFCDKLAALIY